MYRLGNVLQLRLTEIADCKIEPRFHLPVSVLRKANRSGLSDAFQSGRNIDTVTHQIAITFLDNVAEMNANTKFDAPLRR